ncbi:ESPR domain-containing protein [Pseudomonas sp. MAFF 301350]|uniref:ESPR domain-containing protein n=1 Tax=Pseudomonas aegrilactucae TaxID=2854028 RepID=A0A9Q2XNT7_9PSED|nr:ESPR domain-containing protein [Pseudomonas aegrilactucae]
MNKSYKLILNRHLGVFQVAPETAKAAGKGSGIIGTGARLRPLAQAVLLALLGSSSLAMAAPGNCPLIGTGTLSGACQGDSGMPAPAASEDPAGAGTAAATGSGYDYTSSADLTGGQGGAGGTSTTGYGRAGGVGGAGLSGAGSFINNATITGGAGGGWWRRHAGLQCRKRWCGRCRRGRIGPVAEQPGLGHRWCRWHSRLQHPHGLHVPRKRRHWRCSRERQ